MILNGFVIFELTGCAVRLAVGLLTIILGLPLLGEYRRGRSEERDPGRARFYLVSMLGLLLFGLAVASGPGLMAVLQSYVQVWPGAMCIYGVTLVGRGSEGLAGWLPTLVLLEAWLKPATVLLAGAWFCLYLVDRGTRHAALGGRVVGALLLAATLGTLDTWAEGAYLLIPKQSAAAPASCCTVSYSAAFGGPSTPGALLARVSQAEARAAFFGAAVFFAVLVAVVRLATGALAGRLGHLLTALAGAFQLGTLWLFLSRVLAPQILHQPDHFCAYDLLPASPAVVLGSGLLLLAVFCVGWDNVVVWLGTLPESDAAFRMSRGLTAVALVLHFAGTAILGGRLFLP